MFVTGGAGYVGAHCCKAFAEAGWTVVTYDNLSRGWRDFVKWGPLIEGDILDGPRLAAAMQETKPDAVAHFAALTYVGESVDDPAKYYRNNSMGALGVLDAMRSVDCDQIIFSSTAAVYGTPLRTPIDEEHPLNPINPYGWSKLFVEKILADYAAAFGLRFVALRYFNAAGADPGGEIGERHEPEHHVIPLAIRGALNADYTFNVFGRDFDTRDGSAIRDYVHVTDLAEAHLRALTYLCASGVSAAFNLGTGVGTTVLEIADAVERATGRALRRADAPRRLGDPPTLVATAEKAKQVLSWQPTRSDVDHIVRSAWRWHEQELGLRRW